MWIKLTIIKLQAITEHEDVIEAAVAAKPDQLKGHIPVAFCVLKSGEL